MTPSAVSTSAAPVCEDRPRLPCLATGTPAPATTKAEAGRDVVGCASRRRRCRRCRSRRPALRPRSILSRMVATAPEISSTVSPRTRSAIRKPPIWLGVASPDMMMSNAVARLVEGQRLAGRDLGDMGFELAHRASEASACCDRGLVDGRPRIRPAAAPPAGRADRRPGPTAKLFARVLRHGSGPAPAGSNTSVTLNRICAVAVRRGERSPLPPSATPNTAATPSLAEIGVVGLALQAALGLLLELELAGDRRRASSPSLTRLSSSAALASSALRRLGGLPVGDDLVAHLVQRAVAGRRDVLDLVEDVAVGADVDRPGSRCRPRSRRPACSSSARLRQVVDDRCRRGVAPARSTASIVDHLELQLGGRFAQRRAAGARILIGICTSSRMRLASASASSLRISACTSSSGLHHLGRDLGDAHQHRAERARRRPR